MSAPNGADDGEAEEWRDGGEEGGLWPVRWPPSTPFPGRRNRVLSRWRVFAGAVAQASPHGLQLGVQAVVYHGGYLPFRDPNSEENSNDIALVHLSSPLPLTGKSKG